MIELLPIVADTLKRPESHKILCTLCPGGYPHPIVCGSLLVPDLRTITVGEVYMMKTMRNLDADGRATILVWIGKDAYSIHVKLRSRETEGPLVEKMNHNLSKMNMSAKAVLNFDILSVFDEGISDTAGSKIQ